MSVILQVTPASVPLPTLSLLVVDLCMLLWFVSLSSSSCSACLPVRMFLLLPLSKLISQALSQAAPWLLSGEESQCSSGAELRMTSSWQTVLSLVLFETHSQMLIGSKTLNGLLLLGSARIWVAFPCQMLVTLVDGFAHAMVPIMIYLEEFARAQHHTTWKYPHTPSWMRTSYLLAEILELALAHFWWLRVS